MIYDCSSSWWEHQLAYRFHIFTINLINIFKFKLFLIKFKIKLFSGENFRHERNQIQL